MWQVKVKSPTHYFGSFLIQTNSRRTYITVPYFFQKRFKIVRALPQLHKNNEHLTDQIQDGQVSPSILKKASFRYGATKIYLGQSELPVQR